MGSWDACCGISKLPICCGDEVVDFFIGDVGHLRASGFICYSNDLWTPITIQTYGHYADYGRIDATSGWHVDYVTKVLQTHVVDLEAGENEYHDTPIDRSKMIFDIAQEAIHEGRLLVAVPPMMKNLTMEHRKKSKNGLEDAINANIQISRMMIHRFVFDELVSWGFDTWNNGLITLDRLVAMGMDFVTTCHQKQAETTDPDLRLLDRLMMEGIDGSEHRDNTFVSSFRSNESGDFYVPHKFSNYLSLVLDSDLSVVHDVVTEVAKFIIFRAQIATMQFLWTPQTGSQTGAYKELSKLYRLCDTYAQQRMREYDEDDASGD